jgi:hypothetical protein
MKRSACCSLLLICFLACDGTRDFRVPTFAEIEAVEASDHQTNQKWQVANQENIEAILKIARGWRKGWKREYFTPPSPRMSLFLRLKTGPVLIIRLGEGWVTVNGPGPSPKELFYRPTAFQEIAAIENAVLLERHQKQLEVFPAAAEPGVAADRRPVAVNSGVG